MSGWRAAVAAVVAAAVLALAGCGGGSGDSGSVTTVASPGGAQQKSVVVSSHDGSFDPEAVYRETAPGVVTIRSLGRSSCGRCASRWPGSRN